MRHPLLILAALLTLVACSEGDQPTPTEEGFIRLPPEGARMTAGYLTVELTEDDRLTSASVEGVERTELHLSFVEDGINRMRQVDGIPVESGEPLVLEPRGAHLMLIGLREPMEPGETRRVTLNFESGQTIELNLPVRPIDGLEPR